MDTLKPRTVRMMFTASVVMLIISMTLSLINVATVLSAPYSTVVTVPNTVGYEGYISGASGAQTLTFKIYDAATGGAIKWDQTLTGVTITSGLYSVILGGTADPFLSDTFTGDRWIGVTYNSVEQTPRTRITSVPFSLNADSTSKVQGVSMAGMISLFDTACPSPGWTEVASTKGRAVVGLPTGGQIGLQGGTTPLGNGENRTHIHTVPSHTHSLINGAYIVINDALAEPVVLSGGYVKARVWDPNGQQAAYLLNTITSGWGGNTGAVGTFDVMPYVQLVYCKFTP